MAAILDPTAGLGAAIDSYYRDDLAGNQGYFKKIKMFNRTIFPLVLAFLLIGGLILVFRTQLESWGFDWQVLSGGNLFLYLVTVFSMHLLSKGLHAENTQVFLRNAYGGIMLKLFTCAAAAFFYILYADGDINKPALFGCMGLYLIYTAIELTVIMKQSKARRNVKN
jgi:hypothetical protein